ncbi:MAG: protein kinase domain-containing protein [Desulfomonilaceae bacterium]
MIGLCPECGARIENEHTSCPVCRKILVEHGEEVHQAPELEEALRPGTLVGGDYKIVRLVGRGGAGRVYEARQISLRNMPVALKMLHRDLNDNANVIALMKKEVIISRELTHDNIIKIYNLEITKGRHFVVMEYVPGKSFQTILKRDYECGIDIIGAVFLQVCDALQYAHSRGVIHLDIKPDNILVGPSGNIKVCDFGIARVAIGDTTTATRRLVIGSVGFMPPEQYTGREAVSERSDIYALGATVYYALTGQVPKGETDRKGVPPCVFQALQPKPEDRFESIKEFRIAFVRETGLSHIRSEEARKVIGSYASRVLPIAAPLTQRLTDSGANHVSPSSAIAAVQEAFGDAPKQTDHLITTSPKKSDSLESTEALEIGTSKKSSGKKRMLVGVCIALVAAAIVLFFFYHRTRQIPPFGYDIAVLEDNWFDQSRNRDIPVKIYYPKIGKGPFPAIIFSHRLGGTREGGSHLGQHWAANGYISVHLQHKGSDVDSIDQISKPARKPLQEWRKFWNRTRDISFAIDQLQRLDNDDQHFKGRIDLDRIGLAGVGLGAVTTLALAGQVFHTTQGEEKTFVDARIKAAVLLNPNVPHRQQPYENLAFAKVTVPILHIISGKEHKAVTDSQVADHRAPYDHISESDQYLITLLESVQANLSDRDSATVHGRDGPAQEIVRASTAKFWDAYIKGDSASKTWLINGGLDAALGTRGKLEKKISK